MIVTTQEESALLEMEVPGSHEFPDVEVRGDEAVIRIGGREDTEERKVKLPQTTWG
jgi:hypothetical protein